MSRQPIAEVRVLRRPDLHPDAIRIEVGCRHGMTGLTSIPSPALPLTRGQLITGAVFEHEARCGDCDTEEAHRQGDRQVREMTDRAWNDVLAEAGRRYVHGRRN